MVTSLLVSKHSVSVLDGAKPVMNTPLLSGLETRVLRGVFSESVFSWVAVGSPSGSQHQ